MLFYWHKCFLKDSKNVYCEMKSSSPVTQKAHISVDRIRALALSNKQLTLGIGADDKITGELH